MPSLDRVTELSGQLSAQLAGGESVRCAVRVDVAVGADEARLQQVRDRATDAAGRLPAREDEGRARRAAGAVAGGLLDAALGQSPVSWPRLDEAVNRALDRTDPTGVSVSGSRGSLAVTLRDWLDGPGSPVLAVTDRRIVVARDRDGAPARFRAQRAGSPAAPYELLGEVPQHVLREARRAPKLLQRARVELTFTDGSMIALSALKSGYAEQLVAALGRWPGPSSPAG